MTGPEHYKEAQALLRRATEYVEGHAFRHAIVAEAQAHATLALAAATAYPAVRDWYGDDQREGSKWADVTGA